MPYYNTQLIEFPKRGNRDYKINIQEDNCYNYPKLMENKRGDLIIINLHKDTM